MNRVFLGRLTRRQKIEISHYFRVFLNHLPADTVYIVVVVDHAPIFNQEMPISEKIDHEWLSPSNITIGCESMLKILKPILVVLANGNVKKIF